MRDFHLPGRSMVFADNGICATSHPLAAKVAVDMLQSGGNAVDAAIAGAVLLGLCEPQMTGIGGDLFALVSQDGSDDVQAFNGSGRAPVALDAEAIRAAGHNVMPAYDVSAVTIPGAVDGFCQLSERFGKKGLDVCLAPAITYMEAGIPVAPRTADDWAHSETELHASAIPFYLVNGKVPKAGERFALPRQAEVLRRIASEGRSGFYEGEVAEDMVESLRRLGGKHTLDDFAEHRGYFGAPIEGEYRGSRLIEHAPNGQGATAILLNNILSAFDLSELDPVGADRAHLEVEAAKFAYDARDRFIADHDYVTRLEHMLNPKTGAELAELISPNWAAEVPSRLAENVHKETVYLTVVDRDRMCVSLIYSVFKDFGSGMASEKYGILFQNRGAGFTLERGHPNEAGGGKRPMHTIIPAMLADADGIRMPFGVMGGGYQPQGHARIISNMIDFGMDAQAAIDAPRCFFEKGQLKVERGYSPSVHNALHDLGHPVIEPYRAIGGAQAIYIDRKSGVLLGASDPRKDGCAIGY
ncbi:MAG: gamma-glutamyltransferase family protein [Pseudomonadota bacterium]